MRSKNMSHLHYERLNTSATEEKHIELHNSEQEEIELNLSFQEDHEKSFYENEHTIGNGIALSAVRRNLDHYPKSACAMSPSSGLHFMQLAMSTLATILLYLTLSICLTFYQKKLIKELKFPLTIVLYHLVIKFILSGVVRAIYKCSVGRSRVHLDWRTSLRKMAPTGIASGIDIGFSNWGLELVNISLYTMTKSSTIVFILLFAILLGLEKKSWSLMFIVGLIATGLFMFTYKSTAFDALGFVFILIASLSSGIRWSFAQFVMQKSKLGLHNPIDMIYHMQPWMIASLLPLAAFEAQKLYDIIRYVPDQPMYVINKTICKITIAAVLAFLMEISEFLVLAQTSSLTLSIAGIFKDICQLALAVEINGDPLTVMNVLGLALCLAGISSHLIHKYSMLNKLEEQSNTRSNDTICSNDLNPQHTHGSLPLQKKRLAQTVPLLEESDTDESINEANGENAADIIFDVLKRRDIQR